MRVLSLLFLALSFSVIPSMAQEAQNVKVTATAEQLVVSYDLEGLPGSFYTVGIDFRAEGEMISPKSINGDVGKVQVGKGKKIVWNVYKDVNGLSGSVEPVFTISPITDRQKPIDAPAPTSPKDKPLIDLNNPNQVINTKKAMRPKFGSKAGLSWTSVDVNKDENFYNSKLGLESGLFARVDLRRQLHFQAELLFHRRAFEEVLNADESILYRQNYLRGQALLGFSPLGLGLFNFNAGLYYGYLVGGKQTEELLTGSTVTSFKDLDNGIGGPFLRPDFGYLLGGNISFFRGAFALGVLYSASFENILNADFFAGDMTKDGLSMRNNAINFYIQKSF